MAIWDDLELRLGDEGARVLTDLRSAVGVLVAPDRQDGHGELSEFGL